MATTLFIEDSSVVKLKVFSVMVGLSSLLEREFSDTEIPEISLMSSSDNTELSEEKESLSTVVATDDTVQAIRSSGSAPYVFMFEREGKTQLMLANEEQMRITSEKLARRNLPFEKFSWKDQVISVYGSLRDGPTFSFINNVRMKVVD